MAEGIALITGTETREWAYVAMSRGRDGNSAYVTPSPPGLPTRNRVSGRHPNWSVMGASTGNGRTARAREQKPSELAREPIAVLSDVLENEARSCPRSRYSGGTSPTLTTWRNCTSSGTGRLRTRSPAAVRAPAP